MSKFRLEKTAPGFWIINEHSDLRAGYIDTEGAGHAGVRYKVWSYYSNDEIAIVESVEDAIAALTSKLSFMPPHWGSDGHVFVRSTYPYGDHLRVTQNQNGNWIALRNGFALENENGTLTFQTSSQAQRAADLHAAHGYLNFDGPDDSYYWFWSGAASKDYKHPYRIEYCLGET